MLERIARAFRLSIPAKGANGMSLEHAPSKRNKGARRSTENAAAELPALPDDDEVLTFKEWCALNKISIRNGRRVISLPGGPVVTQLSERRIGITRGNNRRWQQAHARATV
jgi:hypothetical protein